MHKLSSPVSIIIIIIFLYPFNYRTCTESYRAAAVSLRPIITAESEGEFFLKISQYILKLIKYLVDTVHILMCILFYFYLYVAS